MKHSRQPNPIHTAQVTQRNIAGVSVEDMKTLFAFPAFDALRVVCAKFQAEAFASLRNAKNMNDVSRANGQIDAMQFILMDAPDQAATMVQEMERTTQNKNNRNGFAEEDPIYG